MEKHEKRFFISRFVSTRQALPWKGTWRPNTGTPWEGRLRVGNFSYGIEKLHDHYIRKTGMILFPGNLNVELEEPYTLPKRVLRLEAQEYGGTVSVNILPCSIAGKRGVILCTDANEEGRGHHPKTIVEVATDVRLRDYFHLSDGDIVEIAVFQ